MQNSATAWLSSCLNCLQKHISNHKNPRRRCGWSASLPLISVQDNVSKYVGEWHSSNQMQPVCVCAWLSEGVVGGQQLGSVTSPHMQKNAPVDWYHESGLPDWLTDSLYLTEVMAPATALKHQQPDCAVCWWIRGSAHGAEVADRFVIAPFSLTYSPNHLL